MSVPTLHVRKHALDSTEDHTGTLGPTGIDLTADYVWTGTHTFEGGIEMPVYAVQLDVDGTYTYIGEASPGTVTSAATWRLRRMTEDGTGDAIVEFADGDSDFDNVFDDRLSKSYS